MQKLLIPTDFSPYAINGCEYALALAHAHEAEMRLLHVTSRLLPGPEDPLMEIPVGNALAEEQTLGDLATRLATKSQGEVKVSSHLETGDIIDHVLAEIDSYEPDLIVMGVTHHSEIYRWLVGSVAEDLLTKTETPILIVPENQQFNGWENIVFASDFDVHDRKSVVALRELLFPKKVHLKAVHMVEGEAYFKEELAEIRSLLKQHMRDVTWGDEIEVHLVGGMQLMKNLDHFLEVHKTDLLVFTTHKRDWFSRLLDPSVTKQMMAVTHTPMLILHG